MGVHGHVTCSPITVKHRLTEGQLMHWVMLLRLQVSPASTHVRKRTDTQKTHIIHTLHSNVFLIASILYSVYVHTVYPSFAACTQAAINASKERDSAGHVRGS